MLPRDQACETSDRLHAWTKEEQFYRDYHFAKINHEPLDGILLRRDVTDAQRGWVSDPASIDPNKTETDFFNTGRNVQVLKHPRYFPLFFHNHTFFEIIYVLSGTCTEYTGEERATALTLPLQEGDLFLLSPGVSHGIEVLGDGVVLNILIRRSTFMDIFMNTVRDKSKIALFFLGSLYERERIPYLLFHTGKDREIRRQVLDMYSEQEQMDEFSDRIVCAMLTILFHNVGRRYSGQAQEGGSIRQDTDTRRAILDYMMRHYRTVTLAELADSFHFSVPYCSRMVKEMAGISFQELITRIRLQQGENLLVNTQMNVADIGDEIGYKNPETFIRAFQRIYHVSPSQYRKAENR